MSFKSIKGQDKPISILKGYIEQGRLEGGYLFTGPEGVGKKLTALNLARVINCQEDSPDPCDRCPSCLKIEKNQHPDVHLVEAEESEIKIEAIRQLQRQISLKPYEGKFKVFIIDNAHRLTPESQGALLKILEEPPKHTLIILISDKPALLFRTIISRCKALKFAPLKRTELKEALAQDYNLDKDTAHFLAYFSEGRIGRALRFKDADILREKNKIIDRFLIAPKIDLNNLPIQNREDVRRYLNILVTWFRDIYLLKIGSAHSEMINLDRKADLLRLMQRFNFTDLNEIIACISDSILCLEQNINTRLMLNNLGAHLWKA